MAAVVPEVATLPPRRRLQAPRVMVARATADYGVIRTGEVAVGAVVTEGSVWRRIKDDHDMTCVHLG